MSTCPVALGVTAVMLPELDFDDQLALCQKLGVTHYSLRPRIVPDHQKNDAFSNWGRHAFDLTPKRLIDQADDINRSLKQAGMVPFGTVPRLSLSDDDDELALHLEGAAAVGAGRLRVSAEPVPQQRFDYRELLDRQIRKLEQWVEKASPLGIKLVIETHAGSMACGAGLSWNLCQQFEPTEVGVIFDLPNFAREGEHPPWLSVSLLADYIDHCHVGGSQRSTGSYDELGHRLVSKLMCPVDQGDLHIPTWLQVIHDAGLTPPMVIEDYTAGIRGADRLTHSVNVLKPLLERIWPSPPSPGTRDEPR